MVPLTYTLYFTLSLVDEEKKFNPNGYLCDMGINSITISNLGIVSRCVAYPSKTVIGDMKEDNLFEPPTQKFICEFNKCNCSFFGTIEKNV